MKQWQRYLAELFGTFVLVFGGTTVIIASSGLGGGGVQFLVPFGFGFSLLAALYAFAEVSGGHFNPQVSLGLVLDRRLSFEDLLGYWIFQFAGGILASLLMLIPFTHTLVKSTATRGRRRRRSRERSADSRASRRTRRGSPRSAAVVR